MLLFCAKAIVKESEIARLKKIKKKKKKRKKKKRKKKRKTFWPFGDFLVQYFQDAF